MIAGTASSPEWRLPLLAEGLGHGRKAVIVPSFGRKPPSVTRAPDVVFVAFQRQQKCSAIPASFFTENLTDWHFVTFVQEEHLGL